MKNLTFSLSSKLKNYLSPDNGPALDRKRTGNESGRLLSILTFFLMLFTLGVGNAWGANQTYTLVSDLSTLTNSDKILIVAYNGSSYYALCNNRVTSNTNLPGTSVTITGGTTITADLETNYTWYPEYKDNTTISSTSYRRYYFKSTKGNWYLWNSGNTGSQITTKNNTDGYNIWVVGYRLLNGSSKGCYGLWNESISRMFSVYSSDFRAYGSSNFNNIHNHDISIFKLGEACDKNITLTYDGDADTHGCTFVLKAGSSSGSTISEGGTTANCGSGTTTVAVVTTPASHYHVASVTATNKTGEISDQGSGVYHISYTQGSNISSTVTVTFEADPTYTVTWVAGSNPSFSTQTNYAGTALTDPGTPSSALYCPGGKEFVGWTATPIVGEDDEAPGDLFTSVSGKSIPEGGTTYYAVFATNGGGSDPDTDTESGKTSTPYVANDGWTASAGGTYTSSGNYSVSPSIKFSSNNNYVQSPTYDDAITNVTFWHKNQGGSGYIKIYVSTNGSSFSELTSERIALTLNQYTVGTKDIDLDYEDGYKAVKIVFDRSSGNCCIDEITITYGGGASYSDYATSCCTPLGTVNGSISLTNEGCTPTQLKATWKMLATTGIASQTLKIYKSSDDSEVTGSRITGISASTSNQTQTITGLNPCETYYVKVENVSSGSSYCEGGVIGTSSTATTLGYTLTVTKSNCSISSGSEPSRICSNVSVTYAASTGYALPTSITVTNAGAQNTGWTWNSGTGVLTINKANVTGNVSVTITPTCVPPVIGTDPADADYYVGDSPDALSVSATLASGTLTYLWKVSTNGGSTWSDAAGTNNAATYSGASLSTASAGTLKFKCIVGNSQGGCTVESGVATITVSNASYFPSGKTIFIQAESTSAWTGGGCVKAWFHTAGGSETAQSTYWLFDATGGDAGKKLFATVVPASGDLPYLDIQRFASNCSDWWNKNGGCSYADASGSNAIRSTGKHDTDSDGDYVRWNGSGVTIDLHGDPSGDEWASSLASFSDQGAGVWTATYSNYAPADAEGESQDFKAKTNYNGWIGNTGSNNNATLDGMHVGSTYNITATLDVTDHSLVMSKEFVKGTVHFDLQGHGLAISDLENVAAGSKISAPSAPSATGYTFGGWFKEPACTNAWNFASDVVNETMTLYAKWTINSHTLTWNWDGGSTSSTTHNLYPSTSGSVNYGTAITKPANGTMSKTGYDFNGWSSDATTMPDADLTITALWTPKEYSVTLDREGADNGSTSVTMTYNSATHTAITAPTKTGYNFGGWYTDDDGTGTQVMNATGVLQANVSGYTGAGGIWTKTTPTTLYAKWTLKTTTVSFNQNSGTGGQTSNVTATYGQAMPSTPVACPTRAGYTFTGYYENSGGTGTKYYNADGSSATNWNKENATWTLYAGWTAKEDTYKTALHTGASGWTSYASGVTKSGGQYNIPNPGSVAKGATSTCEDTHYHFAGWVTDANKEAGTISGNIIAATGKADATGTTYWAVWEKETSGGATTIELNYSNLSVSTSSYAQSSATVGGVGFTINQGYRGGSNPNYLIQMNSSKGDGTLFNTTAISGLQSIKLYCATAGATATIYQGTSQKPVSTSTPDERVGTAACAASTNYTINFTGSGEYFTLKVGGATYFSKIEVSYCTYEDPKAECEACAATPSITGVSLSGSTFSLTSVPVQATGASAGTNCAISSYGFCWGTSASPTGNSTASANLSAGTFSATLTGPFSVGQTYYYRAFATNEAPNTGYSSDGTFTLRSVTFNLNGHGSSAPSIQYVNNGGKASDPSYSEDVTGWRFVGWYDEAACRDGHEWVFGTNTVSGGNATIYAKWLPDPTITFSVPTGVDAVASQRASVNLPTPTGFPSAVDDDCWAFAGWTESSSVNSTDKPATFYPAGAPYSGSQTSAFTLYAVYSRNKYLVVYDNDMLVADADYIITTWYSDDYAVVGVADGNNAEVADMEDNFHDKVLRGLHYYTLDNPAENAVWHLTGTTDSYVLQNKATGKYLDIAGTSLISESSATLSITEGTGEDRQTYKLTGGDNHLVISSSGASVATGDATYYFLYKLISSKYMTSPAEPTYTVTWKVAGEDDQTTTVNACEGLTAAQISALTIPDDDHLEIKNGGCITNTKGKFMGWSTHDYGSASGKGSSDFSDLFKTYDKAPYLTDDITLYAVFAEAGGAGVPFYGLVEEDGDATEGTYLIVYNGTYAMGSHYDGNNTNTYSLYTNISSYYDDENKKIASNGTTNALAYIAEETANGYSLKHTETISSVATDVYLGCGKDDNKALRWDYPFTASTDEWLLAAGSVKSVAYTSRYIRWNNTSGQERFATYGSASCQDIQLYKYDLGYTYSNYRTSCCAKKVTIGTPTKTGTGTGTVTFESGGDAYAAGDEVTTCEGATTITVTITPTNGHQCTALEFTRSDEAALTPDPAITVPFTGAASYNLTFEQNADGVTLNTTVTFVALIDHYIDNMHYNTTINKSGNYGTAPTLNDETKGEQCTGLHYRFIGWIPETDMNMTTGVPTTTANMVAGGATGKYATGTNYYAIWAEEE